MSDEKKPGREMSRVNPMGNVHQEARLASMNDRYGVDDWELRGSTLLVTCDDGERAEIHPNGTVTWESLSGEIAHDD